MTWQKKKTFVWEKQLESGNVATEMKKFKAALILLIATVYPNWTKEESRDSVLYPHYEKMITDTLKEIEEKEIKSDNVATEIENPTSRTVVQQQKNSLLLLRKINCFKGIFSKKLLNRPCYKKEIFMASLDDFLPVQDLKEIIFLYVKDFFVYSNEIIDQSDHRLKTYSDEIEPIQISSINTVISENAENSNAGQFEFKDDLFENLLTLSGGPKEIIP